MANRFKDVNDPVQVYLAREDSELLTRVSLETGLSKAEILRRGLRRVSADLLPEFRPAESPQ